jgi:hypothetical protein
MTLAMSGASDSTSNGPLPFTSSACQHTSADVSIRRHTSACVSIRRRERQHLKRPFCCVDQLRLQAYNMCVCVCSKIGTIIVVNQVQQQESIIKD